ncbi:MAG: hypothetical protein N2V78_09190 [Methanophagales archaeon]|nr:hypothetical protein [Methanophagales archaeon]
MPDEHKLIEKELQEQFEKLKEEYRNKYTEIFAKRQFAQFRFVTIHDDGSSSVEEWVPEPLIFQQNIAWETTEEEVYEEIKNIAKIFQKLPREELMKLDKDKVTIISMKVSVDPDFINMCTVITLRYNCYFENEYHKKMYPHGGHLEYVRRLIYDAISR